MNILLGTRQFEQRCAVVMFALVVCSEAGEEIEFGAICRHV